MKNNKNNWVSFLCYQVSEKQAYSQRIKPCRIMAFCGIIIYLLVLMEPMIILAGSDFVLNTTEVEDRGTKQRIKCFEQFDGKGDVLIITNPVQNLQNYNFDDRASSCCFTGFWFLYEDKNYNKFYPQASKKIW